MAISVFVASSEEVDIQRSQRSFSSITQAVLMSESGGISENLDAGLRNEDSQEDGMPVSSRCDFETKYIDEDKSLIFIPIVDYAKGGVPGAV